MLMCSKMNKGAMDKCFTYQCEDFIVAQIQKLNCRNLQHTYIRH